MGKITKNRFSKLNFIHVPYEILDNLKKYLVNLNLLNSISKTHVLNLSIRDFYKYCTRKKLTFQKRIFLFHPFLTYLPFLVLSM